MRGLGQRGGRLAGPCCAQPCATPSAAMALAPPSVPVRAPSPPTSSPAPSPLLCWPPGLPSLQQGVHGAGAGGHRHPCPRCHAADRAHGPLRRQEGWQGALAGSCGGWGAAGRRLAWLLRLAAWLGCPSCPAVTGCPLPRRAVSSTPRLQVRAPTHIVSSICDDRGEEPTYCGALPLWGQRACAGLLVSGCGAPWGRWEQRPRLPAICRPASQLAVPRPPLPLPWLPPGVTMSELMEADANVGDAIGLLWFKRRLPRYATKFIEMCVVLCADHGPCVSGTAPA